MRQGFVLWLVTCLAAGEARAQTGIVRGAVTDSVAQRPLAGARVTVDGTALSTLTRNDGSYTLTQVPEGERTVRATAIGFGFRTQSVRVRGGETVTADFPLARSRSRG